MMRGTQTIGTFFVAITIAMAALFNGCSAFGADTTNTTSSEQDATTGDSTISSDSSAAADGGVRADAAVCAKERVLDSEAFTGTLFPPAGWVDVDGGGTVERDQSVFHLADGSLKAACTPDEAGKSRAYIQHEIPANPAAVDLQFWMRVPNLPMNNYAEVGCSLRLTNGNGEIFRLSLFITATVMGVQTGAVINPNAQTNDAPVEVFKNYEADWYEIHERVTVDDGAVTFTVTIRNSTTQRIETFEETKPAPKVSDAVGLNCGITYANRNVPTGMPMAVNVDDIVLSVCPR